MRRQGKNTNTMAQVGLLEDNVRIAKLCATMLQFAGHCVTLYENPHECLNALIPPLVSVDGKMQNRRTSVSSSLPIEVLILDLQLPEMHGVELLEHLQSHPQTRNLPLVFCTASNPSEIAHALHIAPYATVVEKPFKLQVLGSAVLSALSQKE